MSEVKKTTERTKRKKNRASHHQRGRTQYKEPAAVAGLRGALGGSALESVFGEAVALYHRLRVAFEQIHGQGEVTTGKLGVLRGLDLFGPQTVPQMARARPVSRQYIQSLVNPLAEEGYVEFIENPAHKRSLLVRLTPQGKDLLDTIIRRQARLLSRLKLDVPEEDLRATASVLRAVRELFEGKQWKQLLKEERE